MKKNHSKEKIDKADIKVKIDKGRQNKNQEKKAQFPCSEVYKGWEKKKPPNFP